MSEMKGQSRLGRRARLAATIVSAMLALPSLAVADHTTCNKQSNEIGSGINCPEFSPSLEAIVSNRVVDSESTLSYEYSQSDHESSTMLVEAYAPKGWQFNTEIRPSATAGACAGSAEAISGNSWRLRHLAGDARTSTERVGAAYFSHYDALTQTIVGCARLGGTPAVTLPFEIQKLSSGHPFAATHGWKLSISTRSFIESIAAAPTRGSLVRLVFDLNQRTSGTWHRNLAGQFERAIFSQASATPVTTDLRVEGTTCRRGLSSAPADAATGCLGNATLKALVATAPFNLSPAPTGSPLDYAKLTGPTRLPGTTAERVGTELREGFGLAHGSATANVTFTQPSANPNEVVKGYALVVALPGNQGSRSGKYVVTKSGEPGFTSTVCGANGTSASCTIPLVAGSLPRLDGSGSLNPDLDPGGKYDVALVTIFMSGKRTDGLCDDGTVYGTLCAPTTPLWTVRGQRPQGNGLAESITLAGEPYGVSKWQFLWRTHQYGSVSLETVSHANLSGSGDNETEPFMLLFVDYATKQAEFVIYGGWRISDDQSFTNDLQFIAAGNAGDGPATSFKSRDNRIIGDGDTGNVQFTNGASPTGTALRFDYVGETDPSGTFGLVSMLTPGDIQTGPTVTVPPSAGGRRPMYAAVEFMEGGAV